MDCAAILMCANDRVTDSEVRTRIGNPSQQLVGLVRKKPLDPLLLPNKCHETGTPRSSIVMTPCGMCVWVESVGYHGKWRGFERASAQVLHGSWLNLN